MVKSKKKKKPKKKPPKQRRFGKYIFTRIGEKWWKCGNLELWAWAGLVDDTWTRTWVFQYKKIIVEELWTDDWKRPFTTLGTKLADGGFEKLMRQIDRGEEPPICGLMEIREKPNSSLGHTHYFNEISPNEIYIVKIRRKNGKNNKNKNF